jgi:aminoglycoside phosphotransferase (APT) family kinase protein
MEALGSQKGGLTDAANPIVTCSSPTLSAASSRTSAESEDPFALFASVRSTIDFQSVASFAVGVRCKKSQGTRDQEVDQKYRCTVIQPPKCGSYNLLYTLEFSDGIKWVLRIPCPGENGGFVPESSRMLRSEVMTMSLIRRNTSIPIPEIYDYCESPSNEIGVPYVLMEFVEGFPVSEKWFDDTGPTPKSERQMRILDTTAAAMSQLSKFKFDKIGSLHYEPENTNPTDIRQCIVVDELASIAAAQSGVNYLRIGPFDTSREYFEALLCIRKAPSDEFSIGILNLLRMMLECIPRSVGTPEDDHESFVLSHPDLDSQNVLVSEDGTLTALLDWDNVHTIPRCIGYSRYPAWITRDWDPMMYSYGYSTQHPENSPEELDFYRRRYAEKMGASISDALDYRTNSHLFEALWIAVSNPMCTDGIVQKIFNRLFPEDEQNDLEEPIYLYETAVDLAKDTLRKAKELRIRKAFEELFDVRV